MDIYCSKCGEPWDVDSLHDGAAERGETFDAFRRRFYHDGCEAFSWAACEPSGPSSSNRADVAALAYELLGDDVDGAAAMLEDAEFLGLLD